MSINCSLKMIVYYTDTIIYTPKSPISFSLPFTYNVYKDVLTKMRKVAFRCCWFLCPNIKASSDFQLLPVYSIKNLPHCVNYKFLPM